MFWRVVLNDKADFAQAEALYIEQLADICEAMDVVADMIAHDRINLVRKETT